MCRERVLCFVGRRGHRIKTREERVIPKEVENVLYGSGGVAGMAVIPVPDEILEQAIKAFVGKGNGRSLTEKDVLKHCKSELEEFAIPKDVEFRNSFSKNASGKTGRLTLSQG